MALGPLVIMTMRSESSTASSTSWVIMMTVLPSSAWIAISASCRWARVRGIEGAERLVHQQHLGESERRGDADPLLHPPTARGHLLLA